MNPRGFWLGSSIQLRPLVIAIKDTNFLLPNELLFLRSQPHNCILYRATSNVEITLIHMCLFKEYICQCGKRQILELSVEPL